jgi:altronate dehydratase small subunit
MKGRSKIKKAIIMDPKDNVATLLSDVEVNDEVQIITGNKVKALKVKEKIQFGHKFAMEGIKRGQNVLKYGEIIGQASQDIGQGQHVHVHNVESLRGRGDLS